MTHESCRTISHLHAWQLPLRMRIKFTCSTQAIPHISNILICSITGVILGVSSFTSGSRFALPESGKPPAFAPDRFTGFQLKDGQVSVFCMHEAAACLWLPGLCRLRRAGSFISVARLGLGSCLLMCASRRCGPLPRQFL